MALSTAPFRERPPEVPAVVWDTVTLLNNHLEEISALTTYQRDAAEAADPIAAGLFDQIERRLREEVVQLQDVLNERQKAGTLPHDFVLPAGDEDVDD
jgi:hypothetical protein